MPASRVARRKGIVAIPGARVLRANNLRGTGYVAADCGCCQSLPRSTGISASSDGKRREERTCRGAGQGDATRLVSTLLLDVCDAAYVAAACDVGHRLISCDQRDLTSKGLASLPASAASG